MGETTGDGFETLRGDKTQSFISRTQAYNNIKLNTRPLSLYLVFLSKLSTQNNISLTAYLYTNLEQENSNFSGVKVAGGMRLGGGS